MDRNNPSLTLPSIELFGKKQAIHSVSLWDQQDERFVAQPRSVANFEWGIVFDGKELCVGEGSGQPVGIEKGLKPVCRGTQFSLFEYCPDKQCMTVLSTLTGLVRGIRMNKSTKALTWGPGYPTPESRNDACAQRFFAQ
ncbi:MAG TPA: hypothetical protein EYN06_05265 [Myxococcales bacterium]|nr:hypothetical protein [Myxococcales bacterium]